MKKYFNKNQKGFTLVETLVSLVIFSVSIVALISITASGVADTNFANKKQTATLLAQEGIEITRFMRDSFLRYSQNGGWAGFIDYVYNPCSATQFGCTFDTQVIADVVNGSLLQAVQTCVNGVCPEMKIDPQTGFYQYNPGSGSGYTRTIQMDQQDLGSDEIRVISTVSWRHGGNTHDVSYSEVMSNWVIEYEP
jgi:prepilin-type N-terminal cleavage/methylation domain-containing protein